MMKPKFVQAFMQTAHVFANLSTAQKLKVGCVIVKEDRIISIGYNGTPAGWDNSCELPDSDGLLTKPEVLHAETNAIAKLAQSSESGKGAALFTTHSPCLNCAKLIYQSGITSVYYSEEYTESEGLAFLKKSGIHILRI